MNDFLSKPLHPDDLHAMILKWVKPPQTSPQSPAADSSKPANVSTPEEDMAKVKACFAGIDDFDLEKMISSRTKPARYISYLKDYEAANRDSTAHVQDMLSSGDRQEARRIAHSLRGASAQLFLVGIQTLAGDVEDAIVNTAPEDDVASKITLLESHLSPVFEAIRTLQ